jgi:acyl carrier protein
MNALTYYAIVMTSEIPNIIRTWKRVVELFNNREFPPLPHKVFPSTQVSGAFKYMLQGEHIGKIVMTMSDKDKLKLQKIDPKSRKLAPQATRGEDAVPLYARDSYTTFKSQGAAVPDTTPKGTPFQEYKIEDGILPSQGVDIFGRVMWESLPQVVVSTRDIRYREQAGPAETSGASLMGGFAGSPSSGEVRQRPDLLTEYVAPRDEIEEGLVEILRNLLGIEAGVNDDFFELGGDSLKASGLVNKIKSKFDINIPVSEIFIKKNIVGIAQLVKEAKGDTSIAEKILQEVEAMAPPGE